MQRKIHNQTLFVAALSVYFGLLIVGAPPQILAQQSNSIIAVKNKNVISQCDEAALREKAREKFADLDLVAQYVPDLTNFTRTLFRDEYSSLWGNFDTFNVSVVLNLSKAKPYQQPSFDVKISNGKSESSLLRTEEFLRQIGTMADFLGRSGCSQTQVNCSPFSLNLSLDDKELIASLKLHRKNSEQAQKFAEAYRWLVSANTCYFSNRKPLQLAYESTDVSTKNSQVFIVIRLPRAALSLPSVADGKAN